MNTWEQVYYNDTAGAMWRSSFKRDGHQYQRIIVARDRWIAITNKAGFDYLSWVWQSPSPVPSFAPKPASGTDSIRDQNDCLPCGHGGIRANAKESAYWAKIAGFTWIEDGKVIGGHAVVFYQPTERSNVFMYDRRRFASDLPTQITRSK